MDYVESQLQLNVTAVSMGRPQATTPIRRRKSDRDDLLASQSEVEAQAGAFGGERKYDSAANLPAHRPHKPTDAEMGPHNFGGGEAKPHSGGKPRSSAGKSWTRVSKGRRRWSSFLVIIMSPSLDARGVLLRSNLC
jgi:hypothetical protein